MSALELDITHGMFLSCTINNQSQYQDSSEFRFKGGRWRLGYIRNGTYHCLRLYKYSGVVYPNPLRVSVVVERESSRSGRIVNVLSQKSRYTTELKDDTAVNIWEKREDEILRAVPEFRQHGVLKLKMVLKLEDSPSMLVSRFCPHDKQRPCLERLSEDFSKLLDEGPDPDIEFQCGGQRTKAHGAVVSARSQVIATMLATDMVEGRTKIVKIPDMERDVFQKFLRYLYTGKLDGLTFEVALNLFEAGDQYAVTGLAKRCSEYVVKHLSVHNACEVLVIADAHSDEGLVEKVVDYMVDKRFPVACEAWPDFCDEHPRLTNKVLNRGWEAQNVQISRENIIFCAINCWYEMCKNIILIFLLLFWKIRLFFR